MKINCSDIKCSACRACELICPKEAIKFEIDERGFKYPEINDKKCIDCGLCSSVCQCCVEKKENDNYKSFLAYYPGNQVRKISQSGGLFYGLAETIISQGGIVYGAALDEHLEVFQMRVKDMSNLSNLQGSKYVQSDTRRSYGQVLKDLKEGFTVLYSGTSCMISGLYLFLKKKSIDIAKLYTCDLICHGVVSPKLYQENIERIEKIEKKKIKTVNFRDKKFGWHSHNETYIFEDESIKTERNYTELFYTHVALRECCYQCQFTEINKKVADITMADFWGICEVVPEIVDDNKGFSLAIIHSKAGEQLLKSSKLYVKEVEKKQVLAKNRTREISKPFIYDKFWKDYKKYGYSYCLKKYTVYGGIKFKIKRKILKAFKCW